MTKEEAIADLKSINATGMECIDYAIAVLEQLPSDDCVSRTQAIEWIENLRQMDKCFGNYEDDYFPLSEVIDRLKNMPPVTPTQCIAAFRFSKEDLRDICNERIEVECTHGTCKDCTNYVARALDEEICLRGHGLIHKDFYCADFEKRGDLDGSN